MRGSPPNSAMLADEPQLLGIDEQPAGSLARPSPFTLASCSPRPGGCSCRSPASLARGVLPCGGIAWLQAGALVALGSRKVRRARCVYW